jgi:Fur family peroxide stress response transcriptional regulator
MKDLTIAELKAIGLKVTPQRQAILKILNQNWTHPSAETIYRELLRKFPGISFATVYNTLSKLAAAEKIQELDIDPQKKRFDPYLAPHHHFYCRVCGKVFDIIKEVSLPVNINLTERENINGHQVDNVQVNLKGICKDCRKKRLR